MERDSKSALNELCMIKGWTPTFEISISGPKHVPKFKSTLTINSQIYVGEVCSTKRAAEKSACEQFLKAFETPIESPQQAMAKLQIHRVAPKSIDIDDEQLMPKAQKIQDTILMIDIENVQVFDFESFSGLDIYIVHGKNYVLKNQYSSIKTSIPLSAFHVQCLIVQILV